MPTNWHEATRKPCPYNCGEQDQTEHVAGWIWVCNNCGKQFEPEKKK